MLGAAGASTSADAPEDYEAVLDEMDGEGSALEPYVVTDVTELQAMAGEPDAHYELGGDIDATATASWNETDEIRGDYLGQAHSRWYETYYSPLVEGTVACYLDGEPIDDGEYSVDHEAGELRFDRDPGEDTLEVTADYRLREPVRLGFEPVGTNAEPFAGTFDGSGYEIRDLTVESARSGVGLFGHSEGTITRVSLVACDVTGRHETGGLVGTNRGGTVREVAVGGSVTAEFFAGGLAGDSIRDSEIADSYTTADVTAEGWAGGLVVRNHGTVTSSYAAGTVTTDGESGGLVVSNAGTVTDGYWDVPATGLDESEGGTGVGELAAEPPADGMTGEAASETLDGFDFVGTWAVADDADGYPVLAWELVDGLGDDPDENDESDGSGNESADDPDDGNETAADTGDGGDGLPGFGVGAALSGLGGAGYLLKRRFDED